MVDAVKRWIRQLTELLRNVPRLGTIRSKITFYLLIVSIAPILFLSFLSYYSAKEEIRSQISEHLKGIVSLKSGAIERWYRERREQIELLREIPGLQSKAAALMRTPFESRGSRPEYRDLDRTLGLYAAESEHYSEIFLMDEEGRIWYSTASDSEGQLKSNRPYFTAGIKYVFLQNMYYSLTLSRTTSTLALPVRHAEESVGVLAARLEVGRLGEIMRSYAGLRPEGDMYLVNNYNYFVTNPSEQAGYAMERVNYSEPVQRCLERQSDAGEYANYDKRDVLSAFTYLLDYQLCVVAELPSDVAYESVARLRYFTVALTVATLGVVIFVAFLLSSSISRPVRELTDATAVAAAGNLDQRIAVESHDELGTLASSFNIMIASLEVRTEELTRSNADLEQFGYIISHDLKEPLRSITGFMGLLDKKYGDRVDDKGRDYIARATAAADRMRQLIEDLLTYSRLTGQPREHEEIASQQLVREVLVSLTDAIETSEAQVEVGELPELLGEPALLHTLLQNLIANAIKFRSDQPPRIEVTAARDGQMWRFAVADNGIGIEEQYADRIFKVFQRLHPRSKYPGTGIGLAVCKKIVERHGGRIWFESQPGEGATFYFTIAD